MGWYGRDKIVKYYNVGFTEKELQEIDAVNTKLSHGSTVLEGFYRKRTKIIKHLILSWFDLEKENQQLKSLIRNVQAQSAVMAQGGASEEAIRDAWTGYFRGVKNNGNVLYPEWG